MIRRIDPEAITWKHIVLALVALIIVGNLVAAAHTALVGTPPANTSSVGYLDGQAAAANAGSFTGLDASSCESLFTNFAAGDVLSRSGEHDDFIDGCTGTK